MSFANYQPQINMEDTQTEIRTSVDGHLAEEFNQESEQIMPSSRVLKLSSKRSAEYPIHMANIIKHRFQK